MKRGKMTKKQKADLVKNRLLSDNAFLEECMCILYRRQTEMEMQEEDTREWNGVGFNKPDSYFLSKQARWLLNGKHLGGKYLINARDKLMKYSKQLSETLEVECLMNGWFIVWGIITKDTINAILFDVDGNVQWIPRSLIHNDFNDKGTGEQMLVLDDWKIQQSYNIITSFRTHYKLSIFVEPVKAEIP